MRGHGILFRFFIGVYGSCLLLLFIIITIIIIVVRVGVGFELLGLARVAYLLLLTLLSGLFGCYEPAFIRC